jgi:hypothetical protein
MREYLIDPMMPPQSSSGVLTEQPPYKVHGLSGECSLPELHLPLQDVGVDALRLLVVEGR